MTVPMLEMAGVTHHFDVSKPALQRLLSREPRRFLRAVDDVSFRLDSGTTLSLVGESGCGKSTVARLAVGLYTPDRGEILFEGEALSAARAQPAMRRRMNMIFQDPYASLNPRWRVRDIVSEPIRVFGLAAGDAVEARVGGLLTQVGLTPADGEKFPHEFSGGQRQRISIARALASEPEFLVCDEPTSALDVLTEAAILAELRASSHALCTLLVTHRLASCVYADEIVVLKQGHVAERGTHDALLSAGGEYARMWRTQLVERGEDELGTE